MCVYLKIYQLDYISIRFIVHDYQFDLSLYQFIKVNYNSQS